MSNHNISEKDNKPTAGTLPDKQKDFEQTTWDQNADHDKKATEAERNNVSPTLPDTASREGKEEELKKTNQ